MRSVSFSSGCCRFLNGTNVNKRLPCQAGTVCKSQIAKEARLTKSLGETAQACEEREGASLPSRRKNCTLPNCPQQATAWSHGDQHQRTDLPDGTILTTRGHSTAYLSCKNICSIEFVFHNSAMSFDLSIEVSPFPSTPSGPPNGPPNGPLTSPLFSDGIDHDEFDISQSSQSSRVITIHDDDSELTQTDLVISKIEGIFATMVDVLAEGGDALVIPYRRRASQRQGALRFPGSTVQEAIKFSQSFSLSLASDGNVLIVRPLQPE